MYIRNLILISQGNVTILYWLLFTIFLMFLAEIFLHLFTFSSILVKNLWAQTKDAATCGIRVIGQAVKRSNCFLSICWSGSISVGPQPGATPFGIPIQKSSLAVLFPTLSHTKYSNFICLQPTKLPTANIQRIINGRRSECNGFFNRLFTYPNHQQTPRHLHRIRRRPL